MITGGIIRKQMAEGEVRYILTNAAGNRLEVSNFGARITGLYVRDVGGTERNLVLGFDSMKEYIEKDVYLGATIGRVAGRIGGAKLELNGQTFMTQQNERGNTLHGGTPGLEAVLWQSEIDEAGMAVIFRHTLEDGLHGFPGRLTVTAVYRWTDENVWEMEYRGQAEKMTVFNPTNHVYFNLSGEPGRSVAEQELFLPADSVYAVNEELISDGSLQAVADTRYDFTRPEGRKLASCLEQGGMDTPFCLRRDAAARQIRLYCERTGLCLAVETDQAAVVVYTFNHPSRPLPCTGGAMIRQAGITFETQEFPNIVNGRPNEAIVLRPGEEKITRTRFRITVRK